MLINVLEFLYNSCSCTVTLAFVRGHSGALGNEIADIAAGEITADETAFRVERPMPSHLTKSWSKLKAKGDMQDKLRLDPRKTATKLRFISGSRPNPIFKGVSDGFFDRRAETLYCQYRFLFLEFLYK